MAQANKIAAQARFDTGDFGKVEATDWQRVSEAELWEIIESCGCVLDDVAIEAGRTQCFECYCEHQG
jgi:hypothetical protein